MSAPIRLDHGRLLDVIGIEGERLAAVAATCPAGEPIPGCPGRTVGETVRHVAAEYRFATRWLRQGSRPRAPDPPTGPPADAAAAARPVESTVVAELRAALAELRRELAGRAFDEPCQTWWPADPTRGFFCRRLAHETTVHRVDVQAAQGDSVDPVRADLAVDGIDEVLWLWFGHRLGELGIVGTYRATVAVHAGGRRWIAQAGPQRTAIVADSPVDATVSASPSGMYLWLWGRLPDRVVVVDGDHDAAGQLWALLRLATR